MSSFIHFVAAGIIAAIGLASSAVAQQVRLFESQGALNGEIAEHMSAGRFSALVEAVAPPASVSTGRVRAVEQAYADALPSLRQSASVFRSVTPDGVVREVTAWWDEEIYVYLGLLTHERGDGVAVLDFVLTGDVKKASRWYLTADNP